MKAAEFKLFNEMDTFLLTTMNLLRHAPKCPANGSVQGWQKPDYCNCEQKFTVERYQMLMLKVEGFRIGHPTPKE